ncbi:MgtC/SapB family protein [Pelotalea chapellei]|uniref:MgtC/SapB family protein n=1 Tax=Pelotalea chapellei TaxID=44671 RepID=A0ABS5UDI6_9BACT|nr:MgtC/SapB family protein [Pelotalea chapellei]MBT1073531.1 MgtC/SapB family protein [Pelotalea chapellei]
MHADFQTIMAGRLLLASLLGALIGLEREIHGRTAGFRTHLLVSLGSALFVAVSINFYQTFGNFTGSGVVGVDPGRVAAQVVTGIGFLGAGAIIREKTSVRGLTTAACLWVAAAIGVACGSGMYFMSIVVTAIALISLVALKKIEGLLARDSYAMLTVESDNVEGQLEVITKLLESCGFTLTPAGMERRVDGSFMYEFQVKMHKKGIAADEIDQIALLPGVRGVRFWRQAIV